MLYLFLLSVITSIADAFCPKLWLNKERSVNLLTAAIDGISTTTEDTLFFDQHSPKSLPESEYTPILTADKALQPISIKLRDSYDKLFQDPRQPNEERFQWDPWFVLVGDGTQGNDNSVIVTDDIPGEAKAAKKQIQYSLERIPASRLFDRDDSAEEGLYEALVDEMTDLASSIGLTAMTPPWVSLYRDGDMQNFHTDAPHGPMAFVLSLCNEDDFQGGETMLLNPNLLEYWKGFDGSRGLECGNILR